jgi:aspartate ammonia-lyase
VETAGIDRFLRDVDLFHDWEPKDLERLASRFQVDAYADGEPVFTAFSLRRKLHVIQAGEVELLALTAFGGERRLALFGPRDYLGEGALVDDDPHSTSARAVGSVVIISLSRERFADLVRDDPALAAKLLGRVAKVISRRIRQAGAHAADASAQYISGRTRSEHDLLGERAVPYGCYYGIQTLRALDNFPVSGVPLSHFPVLIEALAMVKLAACRANAELGHLAPDVAEAVGQACRDIMRGRLHKQFVVDMIQGGAGTSTNMNANEVIANRALEIMGRERGDYQHCHPNNHVNMSQSTNDLYPTAMKIALIKATEGLVAILAALVKALAAKAEEFRSVLKMGRTQLQDAVPMTLGQSFDAYATTLNEEVDRLRQNATLFLEVNLGGTAIGTGINADPEFGPQAVAHLRRISGLEVRLAENLVEATQDTGAFVMYSSAIKRLAVKLSKICNDLRLLSSGPRAGLNEINLPKMQPGSSIMPGKVNPVIPEVVNQIAFKVIGNDLTVTLAAEAGQLELNVMEPVIVQSLFESIAMLENGMTTLKHRCVDGITANADVCRRHVESSIGLVTALSPVLGYEACTQVALEALTSGRGVYELVLEKELLTREELTRLLSPANMIGPSHQEAEPRPD